MSLLLRLMIILTFIGLCSCSSTQYTSNKEEKFIINHTLFPYESQFLTLDNGSRIHYIDEGNNNKPVLLLLHGNPTWSFLYRDIIKGLKNDFRIIAPDYPGFGLSSAPEKYKFTALEQSQAIREFVNKLQLNNITIMVQDWGGPIGFDLALNEPHRVKAFVIGNTWAWPLERSGQKIFSSIMGGWAGQFGSWCCNGMVRVFMSRGVVKKLDKDVLAMYLAPFENRNNRAQTHIFPAQLKDAKQFLQNVYQGLPSLSSRPVLIVWGQQDFAFQEPELSRFQTIFPNHKTLLLKDAGHFIQEDSPEEIVTAIKEWTTR